MGNPNDDFVGKMSPEAERLVSYDLYGGIFGQSIVEKRNTVALQPPGNQEALVEFDRHSSIVEIVAVRAVAVPRRPRPQLLLAWLSGQPYTQF